MLDFISVTAEALLCCWMRCCLLGCSDLGDLDLERDLVLEGTFKFCGVVTWSSLNKSPPEVAGTGFFDSAAGEFTA